MLVILHCVGAGQVRVQQCCRGSGPQLALGPGSACTFLKPSIGPCVALLWWGPNAAVALALAAGTVPGHILATLLRGFS